MYEYQLEHVNAQQMETRWRLTQIIKDETNIPVYCIAHPLVGSVRWKSNSDKNKLRQTEKKTESCALRQNFVLVLSEPLLFYFQIYLLSFICFDFFPGAIVVFFVVVFVVDDVEDTSNCRRLFLRIFVMGNALHTSHSQRTEKVLLFIWQPLSSGSISFSR